MATFHYLSAGEAWSAAQDSAPEYQKIIGLWAVDADRIQGVHRTRAGYAKAPEQPWVDLYYMPPQHTGKSRRLVKTYAFSPPRG